MYDSGPVALLKATVTAVRDSRSSRTSTQGASLVEPVHCRARSDRSHLRPLPERASRHSLPYLVQDRTPALVRPALLSLDVP
eukprot:scaffold304_cov409-Prasinococcus_capsulatus_cf.AAC.15